jgi:hypothetical protein
MEPEEQIKISKKALRITLFVVIGVLILVLIGTLIWRGRQVNQARNLVDSSPTATVIATATATQSLVVINGASPAVSAQSTSTQTEQDIIFGRVKTAATSFMNAYIDRSLSEAKPYMTDSFYNSTNDSDFAGVSSPGRDHFTFTSEVTAGANVYQIDVKVYLKLNGDDAGMNSFRLNILPVGGVDGNYLVDSMSSI